MQNHRFLFLAILSLALPRLNAQSILQQGMVHFRMTNSGSAQTPDTAGIMLLFAPQIAALSASNVQDAGAGNFIVIDYEKGLSQGYLYADGDTTATALTSLHPDLQAEKRYVLRTYPQDKKTILGYSCTRFTLSPKENKKFTNSVGGWFTNRIKTQASPVTSINDELPGFPLELSLRDGNSGATTLFEADQIAPLDTNLLRAYRLYMKLTGQAREDGISPAERAFYSDSSIFLRVPIMQGWKVEESNYQTLFLRNDTYKATCRIQRRVPAKGDPLPQQEKLVIQSGEYLEDVLHLPPPAFDTVSFRNLPALQRTWRYSNGRNYIFHSYTRRENPYDYFPLTDLVELQRAFLVKDVLYELHVQTVKVNYPKVLQNVESMLQQSVLQDK